VTLRVGLLAAVLAAIGLLMLYPIDDLDVWWLLASGAHMVTTRSFPTTDPFSGPAFGAEWINHAWAFELLLYGVYAVAGVTGFVLLQSLFAVATFGLFYVALRREGVGWGLALAAIAVGGLATRGFWAPRPQLVTYLALAAFWVILREYRDGRADRLAWLPVLTALWANFHGGFMVGPALIGLVLVGEVAERALNPATGMAWPRLRRLALAGAGSLIAMFATPFHIRAVLFPIQVLSDRFAQAFIIEWGSPPFQYGQIRLIEGLVLLTLALLLWAPRRPRVTDVVVLAAFLHFGLQAVRNVPLLVIVLLPILARALADVVAARAGELVALTGWSRRQVGAAVVAVALPFTVWWNYPPRGLPDFLPKVGVADIFPAGAVEFLRQTRPPGPLFNDYGWGGYLIWRLYPDYRVSIDGRAAVHGPKRFADHIEIADVRPRWRQTLDQTGARLVLIHARSPLAIALKAAPDWRVLYEDKVAVVLGKQGARS
jgi:hypothetical protein